MRAYIVDAFTLVPFTGNPAGVVVDADGMSREEKQRTASEFRSSETAFVSRSDKADVKVEFFTPTTEVEFCGHATIATFVVLARTGRVRIEDGRPASVTQETRAGVLPVQIAPRDGRLYVTMTQRAPKFRALPGDLPNFLTMLHLPQSDLDDLYPVRLSNTGNWHIMVGVRSVDVLNGLRLEEDRLKEFLAKHEVTTVDVFCATEPKVYQCRNFGPAVGVPEDPVTGSAAGAFGAYLADAGMLDDGADEFKVRQGHALGRPGEAFVHIESERGKVRKVQVSGTGVVNFLVTPSDI